MRLMQLKNFDSLYSSSQSSIQLWPQQHVAPSQPGRRSSCWADWNINESEKLSLFYPSWQWASRELWNAFLANSNFSLATIVKWFFPNGLHRFKGPDGVSEHIFVAVVCITKSKKSMEVWSLGPGHQLWSIVLKKTVVIVDHFIFYKPNGRQRGLSSCVAISASCLIHKPVMLL